MVKTSGQLEEELRDIIAREISGEPEERTLETVFKATLDKTTPEKSGDLRDDKNKDTIKHKNYWI